MEARSGGHDLIWKQFIAQLIQFAIVFETVNPSVLKSCTHSLEFLHTQMFTSSNIFRVPTISIKYILEPYEIILHFSSVFYMFTGFIIFGA